MYLAGGSIGLLLIVWSVLAMKDHAGSAATSAQTLVALIPPTAPVVTPQPPLIPPTAAPVGPPPPLIPPTAHDATPQPAAASSNSTSGSSTAKPPATAKPIVTDSPRPTQQPQTRSRGS